MQLLTDWDGFKTELQNRWPNGATVYLSRQGEFTTATATDPEQTFIFRCQHQIPLEQAKQDLESVGHACRNGRWTTESESASLDELYIAAVAYQSDQKEPGLWIDVYTQAPTPSQVLANLLAEFNADGTLDHADNDSFSKIAFPNIVILSPQNIQSFLAQNQVKNKA
jgi:hypothetical protein